MEQLKVWLAYSPIASFLKVFGAGVLGWVLMNLDTLEVHPAVAMSLASGIPILINWLNPVDNRYGKTEEF
jgi:hypothetical protein